jgi:hypothetical protein
MNWLRRKIRNWLNASDRIECVAETHQRGMAPGENAYTVTIHPASNGYALEYQQIDEHFQHMGVSAMKNREIRIVPPDGDLVAELAALLVAARTK